MTTKPAQQALYALGLQQPRWVYFQGDVRPWEEATLHVSAEAVNRGLNVYEGLKGYWQAEGNSFGIVEMRRHYERLTRSARLLHVPVPVTFDEFREACAKLIRVLYETRQRYVDSRYVVRCRGTLGRGYRRRSCSHGIPSIEAASQPGKCRRQHLAAMLRILASRLESKRAPTTMWRDWPALKEEDGVSRK